MVTIIFDDHARANFHPLTLTRSTGDLRCGILKLRQRLEATFCQDDDPVIALDAILQPLYTERHPDWQINTLPGQKAKLYINSRLVLTEEAISAIQALPDNSALKYQNTVVAARTAATGTDKLDQIPATSCDLQLYNNLSDLIHDNARMIKWDFEHFFFERDNFFETEPGVTVLDPYNIWIADNVSLAPGVVIDASEGPVVLDEGSRVMANSVLMGPLYLGKGSLVKVGAKLYGSTSIGPVCKIGGEVEGCIIQAYTNKQHDGFLGHSYLGEWINLGAGTNNSDLKNNYKPVSYYSYPAASKVDSCSQFLGCLIGDHSKTGISCSINTGTVIGVGCNLWGTDLISDYIPSFSWGNATTLQAYRFDAFCATAGTVKARRGLTLGQQETALLQKIANMEN